MKNRNKTLTGLAAASMVMTQVGQMSVFAKEEPMKVLSDKEEVVVKKTQKELLEEQIKNTLDRVNEAKKEFEMAQETYETYNKNDYALAVSNRELAEKNYLSAKDERSDCFIFRKTDSRIRSESSSFKRGEHKKEGFRIKA